VRYNIKAAAIIIGTAVLLIGTLEAMTAPVVSEGGDQAIISALRDYNRAAFAVARADEDAKQALADHQPVDMCLVRAKDVLSAKAEKEIALGQLMVTLRHVEGMRR